MAHTVSTCPPHTTPPAQKTPRARATRVGPPGQALRRSLAGLAALGIISAGAITTCGGDDDEGSETSTEDLLVYRGGLEAFPGYSYDTGFVPSASPVQIRMVFTSQGDITVEEQATNEGASLVGAAGTGTLALNGGVQAEVFLKVDDLGFEGSMGTIGQVFQGSQSFDPLLMGGSTTLTVSIPDTVLGTIPIAGVPGAGGSIEIHISGQVDSTLAGKCATADSPPVFVATLATAADLYVTGTIVLELLVTTEEYDIGTVPVPIPPVPTDVSLMATAAEGRAAGKGTSTAIGSCTGGTGGTGGTGDAGGSGGTGGTGDAGGSGGTGGTGDAGGTGGGGGAGGGGDDCIDDCETEYPNGVAPWNTMMACLICEACYDICLPAHLGQCPNGEEAGCSSEPQSTDCTACVNGSCAQDDICYLEVVDCVNNQDCIDLNACYTGCA